MRPHEGSLPRKCAVASRAGQRSADGRAAPGLSCGRVMVTGSVSKDRRTRTVGRAHPPPEGAQRWSAPPGP